MFQKVDCSSGLNTKINTIADSQHAQVGTTYTMQSTLMSTGNSDKQWLCRPSHWPALFILWSTSAPWGQPTVCGTCTKQLVVLKKQKALKYPLNLFLTQPMFKWLFFISIILKRMRARGRKKHYCLLHIICWKVALCCFVQEINSGGKHMGVQWIMAGICLWCIVL